VAQRIRRQQSNASKAKLKYKWCCYPFNRNFNFARVSCFSRKRSFFASFEHEVFCHCALNELRFRLIVSDVYPQLRDQWQNGDLNVSIFCQVDMRILCTTLTKENSVYRRREKRTDFRRDWRSFWRFFKNPKHMYVWFMIICQEPLREYFPDRNFILSLNH